MTATFIYAILNIQDDVVKIGYSNDPLKRVSQLQTSITHPLKLLFSFPEDSSVEKILHYELREYRVSGEWFEYRPEVIATIQSYAKENLTDYMYEDSFSTFKKSKIEKLEERNEELSLSVSNLTYQLECANARTINYVKAFKSIVDSILKGRCSTITDTIGLTEEEHIEFTSAVKEYVESIDGYIKPKL